MSDFVVNFDMFGGLSVEEWAEADMLVPVTLPRKGKKEKRHGDIGEDELEALEKSRNEPGTVKQTNWSMRCFQTWCDEKTVVIDFTKITKSELKGEFRFLRPWTLFLDLLLSY